MAEFGELLLELRQEQKMTQYVLAELLCTETNFWTVKFCPKIGHNRWLAH